MVHVRDTDGEFDAPLEQVWAFVGSGDVHSAAHRHRAVTRERHSEQAGTYSWEQEFDGRSTRFSMRWTSFWPLGLGYEVLEGPFRGSKFFLVYEPRGPRTGVSIVGEFVSPTLALPEVEPAVRRFFDTEFAEDSAALLERWSEGRSPTSG